MKNKATDVLNVIRILILIALTIALVGGCASGKIKISKNNSENFSASINLRRNYLTVINKDNPYRFAGEYAQGLEEDLVYVSDIYGRPIRVEKAAFLSFSEMQYDIENKSGIRIGLVDAYRTEQEQEELVKNGSTTQKPGETEHHTGLLLTYAIRNQNQWRSDKSPNPADLKVIEQTLPKYGFILRFPKGKEEETGIEYTPYEIRFVGSKTVAQEIADKKISLEEYLANQ